MVRRDVTTKSMKEDPGAFGNDFVQGNVGKDDVYGLLGNDWLEGNDGEDAIVGDMGKIVNNNLGTDDAYEDADPPLDRFITPNQPFLGATIDRSGALKREVTLYAFDQSLGTVGIGHDVGLGGDETTGVRTGPGQGPRQRQRRRRPPVPRRQRRGQAQRGERRSGSGARRGRRGPGRRRPHDHLFGGYGADYLDVRPRSSASVPGIVPTSDPETWFQIAGSEASHNGTVSGQRKLPRHRLHLRLGSGLAAGERRRQRARHRGPLARLVGQLQRLLPLPGDLR